MIFFVLMVLIFDTLLGASLAVSVTQGTPLNWVVVAWVGVTLMVAKFVLGGIALTQSSTIQSLQRKSVDTLGTLLSILLKIRRVTPIASQRFISISESEYVKAEGIFIDHFIIMPIRDCKKIRENANAHQA